MSGALKAAILEPIVRLPRRQSREHELRSQIDKLFRRLRLAVVHAGDRSIDGAVIERTSNPRSWKSYETVAHDIAASMRRLGCRDVAVLPDDMRLGEALREHGTHLAWLNTGGVQGNCSIAHAPAMLELFGVPYIGHDPITAGILDNKHVFKRQLRAAGIPTADFFIWQARNERFDPELSSAFRRAFDDWCGPFVVKPVSGRASLHVSYVAGVEDLADAIDTVHRATRNHVLVERYLPGREFCVAVCGPVLSRDGNLERLDRPFVFSHLERVLHDDEKIFTSMDVRPITGERAVPLDRRGDHVVVEELSAIARQIYNELSVETLVRIDIRADASGKLFVLEANPKPDLKAPEPDVTSLVCMGLAAHAMTYDDLIMSIFANRIDGLLGARRGAADRLTRLL
jgi:D-alanine-D-alanine ligase